ncbi:hypothetical protein WMF28_42290 [Sorangium sp. So ce590]|uniref:DUF7151 family protein n=1 Tax=Sorangium sp. So ce590 TaxID=3133317 RepID=UPI003F619CD5
MSSLSSMEGGKYSTRSGEAMLDGGPGADGPEGERGDSGADGEGASRALIDIAPESSGPNCTNGGQKVAGGLDADDNGMLDEGEVSDTAYVCHGTAYVCHGEDGGHGVAGFQLVSKYTAPPGPIAEIVAASPDGNMLAYTSSVRKRRDARKAKRVF